MIDRYAGRRVAVTGGASFIGSHLVELLVDAGAEVLAVDDLSTGRAEHLDGCPSAKLLVGDLRDPDFARESLEGAEVVFHLAARHGGRGYIDDHPVDCVGNAMLDHQVMAAAIDARTIVLASSACVYPLDVEGANGSAGAEPLREDDAGFDSPGKAYADGEYGWAKLYAELQLAAFARERGLTGVVCRLFNVYGERENDTHAVVALADRTIERADPFEVWGDGSQRRSFTHVSDAVRGLALAATSRTSRTFNVGSPVGTSISELCEILFELEGWRPSTVRHLPARPVGSRVRVADSSRIAAELGWQPRVDLRTGLAGVVEHRRALLTSRAGS